jgi:hypothetical protein
MALGMNSGISWDGIKLVEVLRPGTVYKLTGYHNDTLVVKSEAANLDKGSFNTTKAAMKTVDRNAATAKALTDTEKSSLKSWAEFWEDYAKLVTDCRMTTYEIPAPAKDLLDNFRQNPHALWYKMPHADLTDMKGALETRSAGDKNPIRAFEHALNATGGLEALGKIIACDMFINNADRINPIEGSKMSFGKRELKFKVIKNVGNIFLVRNGTNRSITGMDFVDPSTGYRHYTMTLDEVAESYNEEWFGVWLTDSSKRKKFCKRIVEDLELVLHPNRSNFSLASGLKSDAAKRLERGMIDGARQLVAGLDQKYVNSPLKKPAGMESRLASFRTV